MRVLGHRYFCHFLDLEFVQLPQTTERNCLLNGDEMVEFLKQVTSCEVILKPMADNVFMSEVDALMYVVLSKVQKHVPYREVIGTTECMTL